VPRPHAITPDQDLEAFFQAMSGGFALAQAAHGTRTLDHTLAGRRVRLAFAGCGLKHLARPMAHLSAPHSPGVPDLQVKVWEGPLGWTPPRLVWTQGQLGHQGEVVGLGSGRFCVNYHDTSGLFNMYDRESGKVLYWIPRAADLPFWEIASPFRMVFHWWARSIGGLLAHAAAVGQEGRGLLLVGKSGSGKSTASLSCLHHGMEFVGDDYVLLTHDPQPVAHSLYSTAKMHAAFLGEALPAWKGRVAAEIGPENKAVLFLNETAPDALRPRLELRAVVMPQIADQQQATLAPRPALEGLLALAPSTIFQLPGARREAMSFFSNFMRGMSVCAMKTGTDLASCPRALLELLGSIQEPGMEVGVA
jgi:hypothetical protein